MKYQIWKFDVTEPAKGVFNQVGSYTTANEAAKWIDEALQPGNPNDLFVIISTPDGWSDAQIRDVINKAGAFDSE